MNERDEFTGEAEELLDALSADLAEFEAQGAGVRPELINKIFRGVHSLKGLAAMLGFSAISELAHALEDMLDRLRMGRIGVSKALTDLLYDALDGLHRLVSGGTVDVAALNARIQRIVTATPQQQADDVLKEVALEEQTRKSLTEYEEHRLRENVRAGKNIHSVEARFDFADFDSRLRALTAALNESGEVISTLPALDPTGAGGIAFRLLYGSSLDDAALAAMAPGTTITSLRKAPGADEEELSLRSMAPTVRVDIGKLDHVMNVVGELLIEKNQLEALARTPDLLKIARNLNRKLNDLQKSAIDLRLVPVGQIYTKLSRNVRKLARELGKEIELVLRGEETELDKMLVEEITDPLMHIIRNAMDHGIEPAEQRAKAGKDRIGHVSVVAYQQGNSVVIDVIDDGRGIDPEAVRRAAVKQGLIRPDEAVDAERAFDLLFAPGFSTAAAVSEISGRGVGLDVVKRNIQDLKGSIDVLSTPGQGTTFRIMLPITLAIMQALIVRAGKEDFAIPLTSVEESLRIHPGEIRTVESREIVMVRDMALPLVRLTDAFGVDAAPREKYFVVVTRAGERLAGIVVDAIVRQQEIVIKSIGDRLKNLPGIAGATEIGDGEIVLVMDIGSLIERYGGRARETRAAANV